MSAEINLQDAVEKVLQVTVEPMYLSEIGRKLDKAFDDEPWSVAKVGSALSALGDDDRLEVIDYDYSNNGGQSTGSAHFTLSPEGGLEETKDWKPYTIVHNQSRGLGDVDEPIASVIDADVSVEEKLSMIDDVSGIGNDVSETCEDILINSLLRQFRHYDDVMFSAYNDPGLDFAVVDNSEREYALAVEVSTRYENPIGEPYISSKREKALSNDFDLVVLAPNFAESSWNQYEKLDRDEGHSDSTSTIVHLHRLPHPRPEAIRVFPGDGPYDVETDNEGFPVIYPDPLSVSRRVENNSSDTGYVSNINYSADDIIRSLDLLERKAEVITESKYRTQIRESIEPLLNEFMRPYKIEQWLIDSYWDKGMNSNEVGRLAGVSGRTIRRWMSDEKWDIVTRGTQTPLGQDKIDIWVDMYEGNGPFPDSGMTGYEIQYFYNRFPYYEMEQWERYFSLSDVAKAEYLEKIRAPEERVTYILQLTDGDRLFPSYTFIIETLRDEGVEIRDGAYGRSIEVQPTGSALQCMINSGVDDITSDGPSARDVVTMRSGFEVQMAEWLSENDIPFGYEVLTIPNSVDPDWDNFRHLDNLVLSTPDSEVLPVWRRIYNKHNLSEGLDAGPEESLRDYDKRQIEPDFVLYPGAGCDNRGVDWNGWSNWEYLIEVAGLYGASPINESGSWYRLSGVAYKELALKLLGLWESSIFVVPNSDSLSDDVRLDEHYVTVDPTQVDSGIERLEEVISVTGGELP